jgi:transcriptional regulator with XRE-family HTH domain
MVTRSMADHPLTKFRRSQVPPWTMQQLADVLGVNKGTVSRWEARQRMPDDDLLLKINRKTGIPIGRLRPDLERLISGF